MEEARFSVFTATALESGSMASLATIVREPRFRPVTSVAGAVRQSDPKKIKSRTSRGWATPTSLFVGGVMRGFRPKLPYPRWLSLVGLPSLRRSARNQKSEIRNPGILTRNSKGAGQL